MEKTFQRADQLWMGIKKHKVALAACVAIALIILSTVNHYNHFMTPQGCTLPLTVVGNVLGVGFLIGLACNSRMVRMAISLFKSNHATPTEQVIYIRQRPPKFFNYKDHPLLKNVIDVSSTGLETDDRQATAEFFVNHPHLLPRKNEYVLIYDYGKLWIHADDLMVHENLKGTSYLNGENRHAMQEVAEAVRKLEELIKAHDLSPKNLGSEVQFEEAGDEKWLGRR